MIFLLQDGPEFCSVHLEFNAIRVFSSPENPGELTLEVLHGDDVIWTSMNPNTIAQAKELLAGMHKLSVATVEKHTDAADQGFM